MISLLLISLFFSNVTSEPVAKVGGRTIYREDIPRNLTLDAYLKRLVFFEIAKEKGYEDSVRPGIEQRFGEKLVKNLYFEVIRASKFNSAEPFLLYKRLSKEVNAKLIQTNDFRTAYEAWAEVMRGRDFGEVSEEYSTIIRLKNQKGDIGWVKWNYGASPLVRKIFSMKEGEISFPLKMEKVWCIIKVLEIKDRELQDYSKMEDGLRGNIEKLKMKNLADKYLSYARWILNTNVDPKGLVLLASRVPAPQGKTRGGMRPEFKMEDMDKVLARSILGAYTIRDFSRDIKLMRQLPQLKNKEEARSFIEWRITYNFLMIEAKRLGIHRGPSFEKDFKDELMRGTVSRWKAYEVQPLTHPSEEEQKQYFEGNKEKYKVPEKRKVYLIKVKAREEAEEIRKELQRGKNFEKLAAEKSIGPEKKKGGLIGYIEESYKGEIGKVASRLSVGRISEPIKTNDIWAILKVTDVKKSYIPEFLTVRYRVTKDLERDKREERENKIFEENKDRFGVRILGVEEKEVPAQEEK